MKQNSHGAKVEKKVPSALPIYLAAGAFLLCALALPIYRLWALAAAALIAAAAYVLGQKLFPPRTVLVDAPAAVYATGEQAVDEMLREAQENVDAIARLNEAIEDAGLSAAMARMEQAGRAGQGKEHSQVYGLLPAHGGEGAYHLCKAGRLWRAGAERAGPDGRGEKERKHHCRGL